MATITYGGVTLPTRMLEKIDEFLESDYAKNEGISSRAELIKVLLRKFFDELDAKKRERRLLK